jgi:hypothetical protein
MTAIRTPQPLGQEKSELSGAISMMELYGLLLPHVMKMQSDPNFVPATRYGVGWATSNGEASAVFPDNSLSVDGIPNVIRVLEEVENNKLNELTYLECNACVGGCVGGPLTFENNYVAKHAIRNLVKQMPEIHPDSNVPISMINKYKMRLDTPLEPNPVAALDESMTEAMRKMKRMNEIVARLPGYDCGSCGSPSCAAFAEDIVCGYSTEMQCIHIMRDRLQSLAAEMLDLAQTRRE